LVDSLTPREFSANWRTNGKVISGKNIDNCQSSAGSNVLPP
jgi:hypothetical protein